MPRDIYTQAIKEWGVPAQLDMAVEEAAEFIKSVNKLKRSGSLEIIEEIADLEIMLRQTRLCVADITRRTPNQVSRLINRQKQRKLNRVDALLEWR